MLFDKLQSLLGPFLVALCGFGLAVRLQRKSFVQFLVAFPVLFSLGTLAYVLAGQVTIKHFNLEYALWALAVGLLISNTVGAQTGFAPQC